LASLGSLGPKFKGLLLGDLGNFQLPNGGSLFPYSYFPRFLAQISWPQEIIILGLKRGFSRTWPGVLPNYSFLLSLKLFKGILSLG